MNLYKPAEFPPTMLPEQLCKLSFATPFLYMDLSKISSRYKQFRAALPVASVYYAMKCNPDKKVLKHISRLGCGFEIASYSELVTLASVGVIGRDVLFSNPIKIAEHIAQAAKQGVYRFAFDSVEELNKIAVHAPGAHVYVRLATRSVSTVPSEGKFGVGMAGAIRLLRQAKMMGLVPYGITFHVGSQMETPQAWQEPIRVCGMVMRELEREGMRLRLLDIGGGFPAYHKKNLPDIAAFCTVIGQALQTHLPYQPESLAIEPGRALVSDAGVMVATAIGLAQRGSRRWVYLDVGAFNGMMEALETGNKLVFPMADSKMSPKQVTYAVTGPSCDSQDTIMLAQQLSNNLAIGDKVFIYTAGAYTTSYASGFNGFTIPSIWYAPAAYRHTISGSKLPYDEADNQPERSFNIHNVYYDM